MADVLKKLDIIERDVTGIKEDVSELKSDVSELKSEMILVSKIAYTTYANSAYKIDPYLLGDVVRMHDKKRSACVETT